MRADMPSAPDLLIVFPNNRPRAYGALGTEVAALAPPVQCGLTAAYARARGLSVVLVDADAEGLLPAEVATRTAAHAPRLVMISTDHMNTGDVTKMAAAEEVVHALHAHAAGVPVLLEGIVPSAYPAWILERSGADYVCQGEPYAPIVGLVEHLRAGKGPPAAGEITGIWSQHKGRILEGQRSPKWADVDALPMTAWDLMPPSRYRAHHWHCFGRLEQRTPYAALFTNYGCPYHCTYCSVNVVAGGPNIRFRSLDRVMDELQYLHRTWGVTSIRILDNIFTLRPDRLAEFCERVIAAGLPLNMWAYARVETIKDPALLPLLKRAGVHWLAYGIEAAAEHVRQGVHKASGQDEIERVIGWTQAAGIHIVGNFIFGLPDDDQHTMQQTLDMACRYNVEWANFYCAMAYPGTKLYDQMKERGVALPKEWSAYGQYAADAHPLATKHVSSREVLRFRDEAFECYYRRPEYQALLEKKFGGEAVALIRGILSQKLRRNP